MTSDQLHDDRTASGDAVDAIDALDSVGGTTTLADIVTRWPGLAHELQRWGLDFCCGGGRTLDVACAERGLDPLDVAAQLTAATRIEPPAPAPWSTMGIAQLVDHLESTHHRYLWDELPRIAELVERVLGAHGSRHPELAEVATVYAELRADLEPHLRKEERVLFPMIRELATADRLPAFAVGSVANPISMMLVEHDRAGALLERLRSVTGGYRAPADGCASYAACYEALEQLEADTHLHVHKENNLLFPAVVAVERRLANLASP